MKTRSLFKLHRIFIHFSSSILVVLAVCLSLQINAQDACRIDSSFTDILFVIDNSGSIDETEYGLFSNIIRTTINNVQRKCPSSQIGVLHYGGAFGVQTSVEYNFNRIHNITGVTRQFCTTRDQFGNCSEGGGDDLNAAMGDVLEMIVDGTLNRNSLNKLSIVIFTDAFGFEESCNFINCSVIRPYTNIDRLKSEYNAKVTVVGASSQAEPSLLAIYASPGGTFDNVRLFAQDCPATFDGCELPRKYVPIEFDSPVNPTADSIASCVTCNVEILGGITADAGSDQALCEEDDLSATLTAQVSNGLAPFTFVWSEGLGPGNNFQVTPSITTTYSVTATDANGCSATDEVIIMIETCIPDCGAFPIIACPESIVLCPGDNTTIDSLGMAVGQQGDPNCPEPMVTFRDSTVNVNNCNQTIYRIWTASYPGDSVPFGSTECTQVIQIVDETAPSLSVPSDITVDSEDDCTATVTWATPTATDNCTLNNLNSNISSGSSFGLGTTYVVYRATDLCGNTTIDSFAVTVIQKCCLDGPIINCPAAFVGCPMDSITPAITGMATAMAASDLCGMPEISFNDVTDSFGSCVGQVIITRTWTATDTENPELVSTCVQVISLIDTIAPLISNCPIDIIIDPDNPTHSWDDPTISDNCGYLLSYNIESGSSFPVGETKVIATAVDMCGNLDTCSFIVTVPEEVEIECPETLILNCLDTLLPSQILDPVVTSPCALCVANPDDCVDVVTSIDTIIRDSLRTTYIIRYLATDLCGTDNECTSEVIIDNTSYIICPDNIELVAPPFGFTDVTWEKPSFQTCCTLCKTKQIPGFLYMGQLGESYYYCSYARVRWTKAQRISEENGGNLASINSIQENEFLAQRLIERHAYIGLNDAEVEGDYQWASGDIGGFRRWKPGQPNNNGNEDYTEMDSQGYWYDVDGREKREFIMEISGCDHVTQIEGPAPGSKFRVGTTTIRYYAEDGCGNTDECRFDIILLPYEAEETTLTETRSGQLNNIVIAPNPSSEIFTLISNKLNIKSIEIVDLRGRNILTMSKINQQEVNIQTSNFNSGVYLLRIETSKGDVEVRKLFIE